MCVCVRTNKNNIFSITVVFFPEAHHRFTKETKIFKEIITVNGKKIVTRQKKCILNQLNLEKTESV
jgi:hypothetical protein